MLPAVLAGTHTSGSTQAVQDLLQGLLQADPARRPTVHGVLRAGILADAYRVVSGLPHWRLLAAAAPATSAAAAPSAPASAAPARPPAASAAPGVDHEAVRHFLLLLRKSKQQEMAQAQAQLAALEADIGDVVTRRRRRAVGGAGGEPCSKRARMEVDGEVCEVAAVIAGPAELEEAAEAQAALPEEQAARVAAAMPQLEELFFQRRQVQLAAKQTQQAAQHPAIEEAGAAATPAALADGCRPTTPGHLESFARDLNELAAHTRLGLKATLRSGDLASPVEMVGGRGRASALPGAAHGRVRTAACSGISLPRC